MKRILLFLAAASMMAVACNKTEVSADQSQGGDGVQIALKAGAKNARRAPNSAALS